jgi:hypothetical protein
MLEKLEVPKLIKKKEIHHGDRDVLKLAQIAWDNRAHIKSVFGIGISQSEYSKPVSIAKKFLKLVGFDTGKAERRSHKGEIIRYYPIAQIDSKEFAGSIDGEMTSKAFKYSVDRQAIFAGWEARDRKMAEKRDPKAETHTQQDVRTTEKAKSTDNHGKRSLIHTVLVSKPSELVTSSNPIDDEFYDSSAWQ